MAVEPSGELATADPGAEQPRPVGDRPHLPVDPGVGEAHDELGVQPGRRKWLRHCPLQGIPEWRVDPARRCRVVHDHLDLDVVGQVSEGFVEVGRHLLGVVAGHGPDVDVDAHPVGNHVGLAGPISHIRREGRVCTCMQVACGACMGDVSQKGILILYKKE